MNQTSKKLPTISVIMPAYNAENYISDAIESILEQSYSNFEFIIINDGSTDSTLDIIRKYQREDSRIVLISRENKGLPSSLNEGLNLSKGTYIARMDADDISYKFRLERQLEFIEKEHLQLCGCHYDRIDELNKLKNTTKVPITNDDIAISLAQSVPFAHGSIIADKKCIMRFMYKDSLLEDYDLWIRMFLGGVCFGNLDESLYKLRETSCSYTKINMRLREYSRSTLAKNYIKLNCQQLKKIIDIKLKHGLGGYEISQKIMMISLALKYKVSICFSQLTIRNKLFSMIKHLKSEVEAVFSRK